MATSCGRILLILGTILALLMVAGWWFMGDHKPGIAPEKAQQELDATVIGTFGSFSPPIRFGLTSYAAAPHYSSFHISATPTGRALLTRDQVVLTPISAGKLESFRGMLKGYWGKNGYSAVHETFLDAPAGRTREWRTTAPGGVSVKLEMDEYSPFSMDMLVGVDEVNYRGAGDPFEASSESEPPPLAGPAPSYYSGPWPNPANADPYWSH